MPESEPIDGAVCLQTYLNNKKIQAVVDQLVDEYKSSEDVDKILEIKESIGSLNRIYSLNMDATPFRSMKDLKAWLEDNGLLNDAMP